MSAFKVLANNLIKESFYEKKKKKKAIDVLTGFFHFP